MSKKTKCPHGERKGYEEKYISMDDNAYTEVLKEFNSIVKQANKMLDKETIKDFEKQLAEIDIDEGEKCSFVLTLYAYHMKKKLDECNEEGFSIFQIIELQRYVWVMARMYDKSTKVIENHGTEKVSNEMLN